MYKLQLKDNPNRGLWLVGDRVRLGTGKDNEWVLEGLGINEHHAQILMGSGKASLQCLSGKCFVNDQVVETQLELNAKDEIRIGQQRLVILDSRQIEDQKKAAKSATVETNPTPASQTHNWSIVANHPQLKDRAFIIDKTAVLGRGKDCDFVVPYRMLSREHVRFTVDNQGLLITDLGSSNGTFVNGKRVKEARLNGSETISFAKLAFTINSPHVAEPQDSPGEEDEINRTMIRPALTMEVALQHLQNDDDADGSKITLEIDSDPVPDLPASTDNSENAHRSSPWLLMALVLTSIVAGLYFFYQSR